MMCIYKYVRTLANVSDYSIAKPSGTWMAYHIIRFFRRQMFIPNTNVSGNKLFAELYAYIILSKTAD